MMAVVLQYFSCMKNPSLLPKLFEKDNIGMAISERVDVNNVRQCRVLKESTNRRTNYEQFIIFKLFFLAFFNTDQKKNVAMNPRANVPNKRNAEKVPYVSELNNTPEYSDLHSIRLDCILFPLIQSSNDSFISYYVYVQIFLSYIFFYNIIYYFYSFIISSFA